MKYLSSAWIVTTTPGYLRVKTTGSYRSNLLLKMGRKNNAELVRHAIRNGLVDGRGGNFRPTGLQ
jgi:hypothetical protein